MPDIMKRNLSYKLISILLAFILWAYVTNEQNPITKHTYDIPLETKGLKSSFAILDMPKTIKVTVQTSKISFTSLTPRDIHAYVDLTYISQVGEALCPVEIKQDSDITIIESKPDNVKVNIDYINSKTFDVDLKPIGKLNNQYTISSSKITPERISITGPQTILDKISSVIVSPEINNLKGKQDLSLPIRILDSQGKSLYTDNLRISHQRVNVNFQVDKNLVELAKPIEPQIIGQVAEGFYIESIDMNPKTAVLSGELFELNGILNVETEKIDISGKNKDYTTFIKLKIPEKATVKGNDRVKLIVKIKPLNTQKVIKAKIVVKDVPSGLTARLDFEEVNILLIGSEKDLRNVIISPWIDLKDYTAGEYKIKIKIEAPKNVSISNISPQVVKVNLQ